MKGLIKDLDSQKTTITIEAVIIVLALASIFLFLFEWLGNPTEGQMIAIRYADLSIAFVFLFEFTVRFLGHDDKVHFLKTKWWQLLAAIPVAAAGTQILRGLMIVRLIALISISVRTKMLFKNFSAFISQTYLASIFLFVVFLIVGGTFSFFLVEAESNPRIETIMDSLWWTISSMTTTGVSIEPLTFAGRMIGMFLMLGGVVTLGVFTASVASYFIHRRRG